MIGVITLSPTAGSRRWCGWRRPAISSRAPRATSCRSRLDPRALAGAGLDRVPDAVGRLRRQCNRGAVAPRRSGDAQRWLGIGFIVVGVCARREELSRTSHAVTAPYLKFAGPSLDDATIEGVADVLRSGWIASGPWVQPFEAELSALCGGRPVRVIPRPPPRIEIALQIAGIGPGDEVITCAESFFTVLNMIVKVGARPVFVDCDLVTRNIDLARSRRQSRRARGRSCRRTGRARSVDMDALHAIAKRHGLRVIEDAALSRSGSRGRAATSARSATWSRSASIRTRTSPRSRAARSSSTTPTRRSAPRRCASTASRCCRTARATSRSPAASSTCPTSTRASASPARPPAGIPRDAARARRTLLRALARPIPRACCRRDRPTATANRGTCGACCCRSTGLAMTRLQFRDALEARGHRHRRIVRGAAPLHAGPHASATRRRLPEHRADRARDGDAAALTPTWRGRRRSCLRGRRRDHRRRASNDGAKP